MARRLFGRGARGSPDRRLAIDAGLTEKDKTERGETGDSARAQRIVDQAVKTDDPKGDGGGAAEPRAFLFSCAPDPNRAPEDPGQGRHNQDKTWRSELEDDLQIVIMGMIDERGGYCVGILIAREKALERSKPGSRRECILDRLTRPLERARPPERPSVPEIQGNRLRLTRLSSG